MVVLPVCYIVKRFRRAPPQWLFVVVNIIFVAIIFAGVIHVFIASIV